MRSRPLMVALTLCRKPAAQCHSYRVFSPLFPARAHDGPPRGHRLIVYATGAVAASAGAPCAGSTAHRWRNVARATALHLRDNHVGDLTHAQRRRMAADFGNLACGAHERTNTLIAVARRKAKALHHGSRERGIRHEMALKVVHDPSPPCFMDVHDARNAHLALIMDAPALRNVALQRAD